MTLNLKWTDAAAVLLVLVAWWNPPLDFSFSASPAPTPIPTIPAPSEELQAVVVPVAALITGEKADGDRAVLAAFYASMADVVERDGKGEKIIGTTTLLRTANQRAGLLMAQQTGIAGRYPGIVEAVSRAWGDRLGISELVDGKTVFKAGPLDDAMRAKAVAFYRACGWAFQQPQPKG